MIRQESLLEKLYTLLAEQFPEHSGVWKYLAGEEKKHAIWLKQLYDAGEKGFILFDEGKIKSASLNTYIEHLKQIIGRAENKELTLVQAVSYTLDFENSLIEKNVFTHFDSTSEKARIILNRLNMETQSHVNRIQGIRLD